VRVRRRGLPVRQQPVLRPQQAQVQVSLRRQVQLRMPLWQQPLRQVPGS